MKTPYKPRTAMALLAGMTAPFLPLVASDTTLEPPSMTRSNEDAGSHTIPHAPVTTVEEVGLTANAVPRSHNPELAHDDAARSATVREDGAAPAAVAMKRGEARLLKKALAGCQFGVALSRQATGRATDPQVRSYAATIVRDHERMTRELVTFASRRAVLLPEEKTYRDELDDLDKEKGNDYDEDYLEEMVESHEDVVRLLEKAAKSEDTDFAAFAVQHLTAMRAHLARAEQLEEMVDD